MTEQRWGVTIPLMGVTLADHRKYIEEIAELGFTDVWSSEAGAHDAFAPLALAASWTPSLRLGSAVIPVYTRGPALLAQSIASLCEAAPGRVAVGLGTSSNVIVSRWNNIPFDKPYQRTRDMIRFLRSALAGEKVTEEYETFKVDGFRLGLRVTQQPQILVGALRPGMLKLAGTEGDGAIVNWLSAEDVKVVAPLVGVDKEVAARIFVMPSEDRAAVRAMGTRLIAEYMNVPVYAAFHEWIGRGEAFRDMWDAWKAGDRKKATESIPDEVLDALIVNGSPEECAEHVKKYAANGITTPMPMMLASPDDTMKVLRALAPSA